MLVSPALPWLHTFITEPWRGCAGVTKVMGERKVPLAGRKQTPFSPASPPASTSAGPGLHPSPILFPVSFHLPSAPASSQRQARFEPNLSLFRPLPVLPLARAPGLVSPLLPSSLVFSLAAMALCPTFSFSAQSEPRSCGSGGDKRLLTHSSNSK